MSDISRIINNTLENLKIPKKNIFRAAKIGNTIYLLYNLPNKNIGRSNLRLLIISKTEIQQPEIEIIGGPGEGKAIELCYTLDKKEHVLTFPPNFYVQSKPTIFDEYNNEIIELEKIN